VILRARHLTRRFGSIVALRDVGFDLRAGEVHAICGENGAGKSTLIKILSGVHPHGSYEGSIEVAGSEVRLRSPRDAAAAGIAVIHQELAHVDELSVAENICLGAEPARWGIWLDRGAALRRAADVLERFGIALDPAAPMRTLGMGQKQLVEIARALARDSRILILDEPTAALAAHEVERLLAIVAELRGRGIACVYISHHLEEVFRIADRISVLRDGAAVCTIPAAVADAATVIGHMVGREITDLYARTRRPPGPALLEVADLAVADERGKTRLHGISFSLHAGEVLGVGGLMGAGRTELLMHLFGAWGRRSAGRITLAGRAAPGSPAAALSAGIALVSEDRRRFGLHLEESIDFNLSLSSLGAISRGGIVQRRAERERNAASARSLKLKAGALSLPVGGLSGGNQQKVVLGKALLTRPRVVLLDEPTRGIDIGAKLEIYRLIDALRAQGCAVLLVSSELPELIGLSDRILMLREGTIGGRFDDGDAIAPETLMRAAIGLAPAAARRAAS
jgi:D-xylose transport system ATP-binding protein